MLSSFADSKSAILEKGGNVPDGKGYGYYANAVKQLYSSENIAENKYPARLADIVAYMINLVRWCAAVKEQIRIAIVDGGVDCDENVPLSEYGNKIRQIAILQVVTKSLPSGIKNVPYSVQLEAAGGTPPYKWAFSSGIMPAGLSISTTGLLSGTPTHAASYNGLGLSLTDAAGKTIYWNKSIRILPPRLTIAVTAPKNIVYDGQPHTATVVCYNYDTDPDCTTPLELTPTIRYGSASTAVAAGTYIIKITAPSGYLVAQQNGDKSVTISRAEATVTFSAEQTVSYDGQPHEFAYSIDTDLCVPTVRYKTYASNDVVTSPKLANYTTDPPTDAGKYRVLIATDANHTFTGQSTGYKTASYLYGVLEITE